MLITNVDEVEKKIETNYNAIENHLKQKINDADDFLFDSDLFDEEMDTLSSKYGIPREIFISFFRNLHMFHVKKHAPLVQRAIQSYADKFREGSSLIDLSKGAKYPPYLFARYLVAELAKLQKKELAEVMKSPDSLKDKCTVEIEPDLVNRLVEEIKEVVAKDPAYGPRHDQQRQRMGIEYEVVLEYKLKELGVLFETESDLRELGTARTPDVLLTVPMAVKAYNPTSKDYQWQMISWIDSKALFGDIATHNMSVLPQAESYVHRFGPGMVLYWFGHGPVSRLGTCGVDIVIKGFELPAEWMLPTGVTLHNSEVA